MRALLLAFVISLLAGTNACAQSSTSSTGPQVMCEGDLSGTYPQCNVRKAAIGGARGVNMNTTADQALSINQGIALPFPYFVTGIALSNCTATPGALTAGGIYTAANKGGNAVVPAATGYGGLAAIGRILNLALISATSPLVIPASTTQLYFSLSVASGSASLCDVFLYGQELALPGGN